jgi:hypothetical protein
MGHSAVGAKGRRVKAGAERIFGILLPPRHQHIVERAFGNPLAQERFDLRKISRIKAHGVTTHTT